MNVALVGAGPGDPELITVRGLRLLEQCDAVVYDRLVAEELLAHVPENALLIPREHLTQAEINTLLIDLARSQKRVVRLKGGDPCLFGRGGEEALALAAAGVNFEIIPGVSSLQAVPASAGIPITHRGSASAVTAFSAHDVDTLDVAALAAVPGTLVAFMGGAAASRLAARLIAAGKPAATAAAAISRGTTAQEQVVTAPLGAIGAAAEHLPTPCLLVIGDVVTIRDRLAAIHEQAA